jgi:alkaline phosphatase D
VAAVVDDLASGQPVGVELTAPSLTSQNLDEKLGLAPRDPRILRSEEAYVAAHDHVRWCEMASHGFVVVDVDADRLRGEWWHLDTVLERSRRVRLAAAYEVPAGEPRLVERLPARTTAARALEAV